MSHTKPEVLRQIFYKNDPNNLYAEGMYSEFKKKQ